MLKIATTAALAGLVFYLALYNVTVAEWSTGMVERNALKRSLKGDRLPIRASCSTRALLHDGAKCLRKHTPENDQPQYAKEVRIVSVNHLPTAVVEFGDYCDCHQ